MPLVRISLQAGKPDAYRSAIADNVYLALRETVNIPEGDRFQIVTEHKPQQLIFDPNFMGMQRSTDFVLIRIFLTRGRSTAIKQALFRSIVDKLGAAPGIRPDDVMIVLTEVGLDDWSFGRGEAQYVLHPPAWAAKSEKPPA
jgi:phenylpyruvate tautomerase PptA (4-oxalocrotonate tautomerase family)